MLEYDIKSAHRMVAQQKAMGTDVRWEGHDIVFWRPDHRGYTSGVEPIEGGYTSGAFRNGQWGFENRFVVNSQGKWTVDPRNIKRSRRARSRR